MSAHCRFADCEEKPGLFGTAARCIACGLVYCPRHLADGDYARFVRGTLPDVHPTGKGFCIDCVQRHLPLHVKGAVDKKCTRIDCLASLSNVATIKRLCSYCGRWFCSSHFLAREDLTTELLTNLKPHRKIDGEGACEECLKKDPVGALILSGRGSFQRMGAALSEGFAARVQHHLPEIAHKAGESLAAGTVSGIRDRESQIAEVAKKALDAPVKQRIWATVIGLAGAQLAILVSMAYGSQTRGGSFFQTYRWVFFGIVLFLFLLTCVTTTLRLYRMWKAVEKAGEFGSAVKDVAKSTLMKALAINLPVLLLVLALTVVAGVLFAMQK